MNFGTWTKKQRKAKGISARELSDRLKRSPSYVSQIERGLIKDPSFEVIYEIVDVLGEKVDSLVELKILNKNVIENNIEINKKSINTKEEMREKINEHLDYMNMEQLNNYLYLFEKRKDILELLADVNQEVKRDKIPFAYNTIKVYIEFMIEQLSEEKKKFKFDELFETIKEKTNLQVNDRVEITTGEFKGYKGVVKEQKDNGVIIAFEADEGLKELFFREENLKTLQ